MNVESPAARNAHTRPSWTRIVNILLGAWLFISAFAWPHSMAQRTNTWILGILAVVFALIASFADARARFLNTVLAIWLFISAFALPRNTPATVWNNVIVAILIFALSLVPSEVGQQPFRRTAHP